MDSEDVRALEFVLLKDRDAREEQLARFEQACELVAVSNLMQVETFGPSGTALPLAEKVAELLKKRGVL